MTTDITPEARAELRRTLDAPFGQGAMYTVTVRPETLLALLDALEAAERERDIAYREAIFWEDNCQNVKADRDRLAAEVERLRGALGTVHDRIANALKGRGIHEVEETLEWRDLLAAALAPTQEGE